MTALRFFIMMLCMFSSACGSPERIFGSKAPLINEGKLILYLQPMPQEAQNLRFSFFGIYAVREDGNQTPLELIQEEISAGDLIGIQKRLASAILPPGVYSGISIHLKQASLKTDEGDAALLVADEPIQIKHVFDVTRRQVSTLFLTLKASGNIKAGFRFAPSFSLASSGRVLINLTGYVTNADSNIISVFNKKTMQVVGTIATGQGPKGLVFDKLRARAYVAASRDNIIEVIDIFKGQVINRLRLNLRDRPIELALTTNGRTMVSVNNGSNTVSIIDALSMIERAKINVGEGPVSAVIDPSGIKAFVMNERSSSISVVDLTQRGISVTIGVEGSPLRAAFNREGSKLFVIGKNSPNLNVIDLNRLAVTDKVFVGLGAISIRVDDQTGLIYVGKSSGGEIRVIDPFALVFIDMIRVAGEAAFMTIDDEERNLFVVIPNAKMLQKINLISKQISAAIDVAEGAYAVAVLGER